MLPEIFRRCPACGASVRAGVRFCPQCGVGPMSREESGEEAEGARVEDAGPARSARDSVDAGVVAAPDMTRAGGVVNEETSPPPASPPPAQPLAPAERAAAPQTRERVAPPPTREHTVAAPAAPVGEVPTPREGARAGAAPLNPAGPVAAAASDDDAAGDSRRVRAAARLREATGNLKPRVERMREEALVAIEETPDDSGMRFVIIAAGLFAVFLVLLLLSVVVLD